MPNLHSVYFELLFLFSRHVSRLGFFLFQRKKNVRVAMNKETKWGEHFFLFYLINPISTSTNSLSSLALTNNKKRLFILSYEHNSSRHVFIREWWPIYKYHQTVFTQLFHRRLIRRRSFFLLVTVISTMIIISYAFNQMFDLVLKVNNVKLNVMI